MKQYFGVVLLTGAGALVFGAANAQTSPNDAQVAANQAANGQAAASEAQLQEVTVTGSRVITNGNNSPTPVTVVPIAQMLTLQPTTVADAVNDMPELIGSQNTESPAGGGQRNGAAQYFDLRDMGDLRTLVLYDGFRVVPTINQNEGNVDASIVPQMLLQRVDLVTGGVSAVYGSDAISGVVNFITDTHFNGVKVQAETGISTYADDRIVDTGIAAGENLFSGRGHVEFSYEYHEDPGICCRDARPNTAEAIGQGGAGTAASPYYVVYNTRTSSTSFGGLITGGPLSGLQFAQNGVLSPFVAGAATGVANQQSGGDGGWLETTSIKSADTFHQLFGRIDYDFTDNLHGFLQVAGTLEHSEDNYQPPSLSVNIGYNNPFLASIQQPYQSELAAQAAKTPNGSFSFAQYNLEEPTGPEEQWTDSYMIFGGVNGLIGNYKWNVGFEQALSQILAQNDANINLGSFYAATNAVVNPATGQISCAAAATNPAYANCVPLNLFGPTAASQAALAYIRQPTWNLNHTVLSDLQASITGAPVSTWVGPINMALSAEARRTGWSVSSNASPTELANCTGIQFSCSEGFTKLWDFNSMPGNPPVSQNVGEIAYETDIPLAKDLPAVQALNLNGAVRETYYSNSGLGYSSDFNATTWKLGLEWHVTDDLTVRGTRSRDIRSPNLWELYSPTTVAPLPSFTDPLTHTSAPLSEVVESNPHLVPEVANTLTTGLVYQPHFVPGFSVSVDYFHIYVANEIFQLQGQSTAVLQTCDASGGTASVCSLIVRPYGPTSPLYTNAANFPTILLSQYLNIASLETYGGDFETDYVTHLGSHALNLRGLVTYQPHFILNEGPAGVLDMGDADSGANAQAGAAGEALPSVKLTVIAQYGITQDFTASAMERWRNSLRVSNISGLVYSYDYPSVAYTTLNFSYLLHSSAGQTELFLNIANLFNTLPTLSILDDDIVGRYFMLGFRYRH